MELISWIIFGIIAGGIAKMIHPGEDPGNINNIKGIAITAGIGIAGAAIGGFIGTLLHLDPAGQWSMKRFALAIIGALILLYGYRRYQEAS